MKVFFDCIIDTDANILDIRKISYDEDDKVFIRNPNGVSLKYFKSSNQIKIWIDLAKYNEKDIHNPMVYKCYNLIKRQLKLKRILSGKKG